MRLNLLNLVQAARHHIYTVREAVIDADGINAPVAERAALVLDDINTLETMLRERRTALRREIETAQNGRVKA